jgi:tRNA (guanine26-N2/guanine27-N2)-dimethyltransferase
MIKEGKVILNFESPKKVSKELDVFYNPVMKLNRDISVEVVKLKANEHNYYKIDDAKTGELNPLRVGLPLSGSGIRGIRFLKECSEAINYVSFNDLDRNSILNITDNLILNKYDDFGKFNLHNELAQSFLLNSKGFDYIDLDPFGTPNPFLDSACQRISRDGILAVTATDTAPLSGTYPKVCRRNYDAEPLRNELMHIVGLRILIRKIQIIGMQYEKALIPIYSYSKDHYFRVFLKCVKSKTRCDSLFKSHKYLLFCKNCHDYHFSDFNIGVCESCGSNCDYSGKMYSGSLWDEYYANNINLIKEIPEESSFDGKYYNIHKLCAVYKAKKVPLFKKIIDSVKNKGYYASRSHFSKELIKTNIDLSELKNIILDY